MVGGGCLPFVREMEAGAIRRSNAWVRQMTRQRGMYEHPCLKLREDAAHIIEHHVAQVAQPTMPLTITVQSITGHSLEITLQPTANAAVLKSMVMGAMGMQDKSQIALYFAGEQLDPDSPRPLADFGLEEASVVRYALRLRGGVFRARLPCRALITPAPNATNVHPHQSICIEVDFRESHDQLQLQLSGYQGSMRTLVLDRGPLMTLEAVDKLLSGLSLTVVQIRRALVRRTPDCVITRWNRAEALGAALVMREHEASREVALIVLDHLALSPEDFEAGEVVPVLCSVRSHALQTPGRFQLVATPPPPPRGPLFGFGWELNAHYRIDLCPDLTFGGGSYDSHHHAQPLPLSGARCLRAVEPT